MPRWRPRLGIPVPLRPDVYALIPIIVASWALGGLYLSLGPSVAVTIFGLSSHLIGGLVVTLLSGTAALTAFALRRLPTSSLLDLSAVLLSVGVALTLAAVETHAVGLGVIGTVIAGAGFGASGLGSFGTLARIAGPGERSELLAAALVIAYLAFSLPAVAAGLATTSVGLRPTTAVYSLCVVALSLLALAGQRVRRSRAGL